MHRKTTVFLCCAVLALAATLGAASDVAPEPASPATDGTLPALTSIAGEGMLNSHAYDYLEQLSDDIGGRVTGSPACQRAIEWGVEKMKAIGLENVHTEKWQMSRGWTRVSASAELLEPLERRLKVDSMGWVGSTPAGGAEGEVVPVNDYNLDNEMKQNASSWAGKILLVVQKGEPPKDRMSSFAKFGPFLKAAYKAHAIAVIGGQGGRKSAGMRLTHTGALGFDTFYDIPVVSITAEDQDLLERFLDHGKTPRMRINVQNRITDGPVETANVVGEIRGTEHPEQIIVAGGHLDSWDLSEGATDDGTGVASVLGAAEAIVKSGRKPRRTIRFVLFTGEEQGLLGSEYYTEHPLYPLARTAADINMDALNVWGPTRDIVSIGMGASTIDKTIAAAAHSLGRVVRPDAEPGKGYFFRSDHFSFVKQGVPAFDPDSGVDYIGKPAGWGAKIHAEYTANDYHKPTDVIKPDWNLEGTVKDCELFFLVGYDIANASTMPTWNPDSEFRAARVASLKAAGMEQ